jgi:hypothetical protein
MDSLSETGAIIGSGNYGPDSQAGLEVLCVTDTVAGPMLLRHHLHADSAGSVGDQAGPMPGPEVRQQVLL